MPNGLCSVLVKQLAKACKQQLEVVVQLGHGAHGRARAAHRVGLVNRNGGRHAFDLVHRGFVHPIQKLPRIGAEGLYITSLAFGIQGVKNQTRLARTAGSGDHGQFTRADVKIDVFEVVLTGTTDADETLGHAWLYSVEAKHSRSRTVTCLMPKRKATRLRGFGSWHSTEVKCPQSAVLTWQRWRQQQGLQRVRARQQVHRLWLALSG